LLGVSAPDAGRDGAGDPAARRYLGEVLDRRNLAAMDDLVDAAAVQNADGTVACC
jgi:hypothetical protein